MNYVYDILFYLIFWKIAFTVFPMELFSWQWFFTVFVALVCNGISEKPIKEFLRDLGNS